MHKNAQYGGCNWKDKETQPGKIIKKHIYGFFGLILNLALGRN